jgi:hypothetical protein
MRIRRLFAAATIALSVVALAACRGSVTDPAGDAHEVEFPGTVDIIEAGIDYGKELTQVWVRYAPDNGPAHETSWRVSIDGDESPEIIVTIGQSSEDYYTVRQGVETVHCSGFVPNGGFDEESDTTSLTFATRCFPGPGTDVVFSSVRVAAQTASLRSFDYTGYTAAVAIS